MKEGWYNEARNGWRVITVMNLLKLESYYDRLKWIRIMHNFCRNYLIDFSKKVIQKHYQKIILVIALYTAMWKVILTNFLYTLLTKWLINDSIITPDITFLSIFALLITQLCHLPFSFSPLKLYLVVNAAHTFYNGTTTLPISEEDRTPRKRISKTLNMTTNPEEKRKIIGDTFVKVSNRFYDGGLCNIE